MTHDEQRLEVGSGEKVAIGSEPGVRAAKAYREDQKGSGGLVRETGGRSFSGKPVAEVFEGEDRPDKPICGFESYNQDDGEWYSCQLDAHGSKVKHGDWKKL